MRLGTPALVSFGTPAANAGEDAPPQLQIEHDLPGAVAAVVTVRAQTRRALVPGVSALAEIASRLGFRDAEALTTLAAAHRLGADVLVTLDERLLANRDGPLLSGWNLLTPEEAFVAVGAWTRSLGMGRPDDPATGGNFVYYWAVARGLTPHGWAAYAAWVTGEHDVPGWQTSADLAGSVFSRLDCVIRSLDEMYRLWQRRTNNETIDAMQAEFDVAVLRTWAIHDVLALLSGTHLQFPLDPRHGAKWGFLAHDWQAAARKVPRGSDLLATVAAFAPRLRLSQELRHHAIHRAQLATMSVHGDGQSRALPEKRIRIPAGVLARMKRSLDQIGDPPRAWGIGDEVRAHTLPVTVRRREGWEDSYEEPSEGWALLDPVPFAIRMVAAAAELADKVFEVLDPASDPALPERLQALVRRIPEDYPFRPRDLAAAILSSPLAGTQRGFRGALTKPSRTKLSRFPGSIACRLRSPTAGTATSSKERRLAVSTTAPGFRARGPVLAIWSPKTAS